MELETLNRKQAADNEINWVTATFMALFHVGAIAALFFFTWKALFVAMFLWWVSGSLGITDHSGDVGEGSISIVGIENISFVTAPGPVGADEFVDGIPSLLVFV